MSQYIKRIKEGKIYKIIIDRPQKKNAVNRQMYDAIREGLEDSAQCTETTITVLCANGDYYSSGNDLSGMVDATIDIETFARNSKQFFRSFVIAFIDHPKPLIALVNGPAIGISVTTLALCDMVFASDKATFSCPFTKLGQVAEGCSTFTFPILMGPGRANEVLMFGRKLNAIEAQERNLVSYVIPDSKFREEVWKRLNVYADNPPNTLRTAKRVIRAAIRDELHATNNRECDALEQSWQSEECANAIMQFFMDKQKANL